MWDPNYRFVTREFLDGVVRFCYIFFLIASINIRDLYKDKHSPGAMATVRTAVDLAVYAGFEPPVSNRGVSGWFGSSSVLFSS